MPLLSQLMLGDLSLGVELGVDGIIAISQSLQYVPQLAILKLGINVMLFDEYRALFQGL